MRNVYAIFSYSACSAANLSATSAALTVLARSSCSI